MAKNKHPNGGVLGKKGMTVDIKVKGNSLTAQTAALESAIRLLRKRMMTEGLVRDMKRKEFYEKGAERRVREKREKRKRWEKKQKQINELLNGPPAIT